MIWKVDAHGWKEIPVKDGDIYTKRWYRVSRGGYTVLEVQHTGILSDNFEARVYEEVTDMMSVDGRKTYEWSCEDMAVMSHHLNEWFKQHPAP